MVNAGKRTEKSMQESDGKVDVGESGRWHRPERKEVKIMSVTE